MSLLIFLVRVDLNAVPSLFISSFCLVCFRWLFVSVTLSDVFLSACVLDLFISFFVSSFIACVRSLFRSVLFISVSLWHGLSLVV